MFALAWSGRGAVQRELAVPSEADFLTVGKQANPKHLQANTA
ncbi:hypothetical protein [Polaromonas sp. CG9_12]|nr:hypothetical protein [Polaromonas sp. CG9_12]